MTNCGATKYLLSKNSPPIFRMLEVKPKLPCGVHKFLAREEYDLVYDLLTQAESGEWSDVCSDE